jgi:hypothetical protein
LRAVAGEFILPNRQEGENVCDVNSQFAEKYLRVEKIDFEVLQANDK